ncbi:MAG: excinuclease ABC subunit UvrC [Bacteroidaceae bacterium]|nr:excinuclease ABC subunit UvrC [Bacteroidaceae bacterium]
MIKEEERLKRLKLIVNSLSEKPGCYQYLDSNGRVIYVGKAKNLKRRVSSYFNNSAKNRKTEILVSKIQDIKYIIVPSDEDALLLENNLIKKYKPFYNILLKDDKSYPSMCVTNEYLPRVFKTRNIDKKQGTYYGPFSHQGTLNAMIDLINKLYKVRLCKKPITKDGIEEGRYNDCMYHHIKKCNAPCLGLQSREEYLQQISDIKEILSGNTRNLCSKLMDEMMECAANEDFIKAESIKQKYILAKEFDEKSRVITSTNQNIDVFTIEVDENRAFVNYMHVTNGCINQAFTFEYKKKLDETKEEILSLAIVEMRERYGSKSKEIVLPFDIDIKLKDVEIIIPRAGDKKKLLLLSETNVRQFRTDALKQADKLNPDQRNINILKELQHKLKLDKIPMRIECFDNSNIMGQDAVAGCVVFIGGKKSKNDYRKYNIKSVIGPDDYASMREVVYRKYTRSIEESTPLPDLIITDGGKGQMEVVRSVIEDELQLNIPIAGLAKDNHHRTNQLLFGFPQKVIGIEMDSPLFRLLTQIQDEVHRFAITFHKSKRIKHTRESELDSIKGIGDATKKSLLKQFKSVEQIKKANIEELEKVVGKAKAAIIAQAFDIKK